MTGAMLQWWRGRTGREQVLLAAMVALLVVVIGWLGIAAPLARARADASARLALANADLGEIRANTVLIRAAEARARTTGAAPLLDTIRQRAAEAGFSGESIAGDGAGDEETRVTMRLPAIKPAVLLRWIADIEARDGILVDRLMITRNGDATVAVEAAMRRASP